MLLSPWIIAIFAALLLINAFGSVSITFSLGGIVLSCAALFAGRWLWKRAASESATEQDVKNADIFTKIAMGVAAFFVVIGVLQFFIGFFNSSDSQSAQACTWCGGDRWFMGKICSFCDGRGYYIHTDSVFSPSTWQGLVQAFFGVAILIGLPTIKGDSPDLLKKASNRKAIQDKSDKSANVTTPAASFDCSLGHMENDTWIENTADSFDNWDFKCNFNYYASKPADMFAVHIIAYDGHGAPYGPPRVLLDSGYFVTGMRHTKTWEKCWENKKISKINIAKTTIYYADGTMEETEHSV